MATFDQLSDEQRAIVELVLKQGKSYDELSDMLGLPETRVRELARDALVDLAPITAGGVEEDWRGQLADYVLGQQAGPEATATRGHLRRSEAARAWTRSLLDALEQLYPSGDMPAIPDGERGRRAAAAAPKPGGTEAGSRGLASGDAAAAGRRRLLAAGAALLVLVLVVVLIWPVGVLTGGDDDEPSEASAGSQSQSQQPQGGDGAQAGDGAPIPTGTAGQAIIARQEGATQILVTASGLEPSRRNTAYQVYLANSEEDRRSLGATVTDEQGNLQAGAPLPGNFEDYEFIDLAAVTVQGRGQNQRFDEGPTVLRGILELNDNPRSRNGITLLGQVQLRPLPE